MKEYLKRLRQLVLVGALALLPVSIAAAQVPTSQPPYNTDIGAVITNSLRGPGTVTSSQLNNLDKTGVVCTFQQSAVSGSPSTTFSIQGYDAATNSYNTLVTSGTITTSTSNIYALAVHPGIAVSSLPANYVAQNIVLPRIFRVSQTIAGGGTATTSKIGCVIVK